MRRIAAIGNTINFGEKVAAESEMTAFVVFALAVLDREDYLVIDVGISGHEGHDVINEPFPVTAGSSL